MRAGRPLSYLLAGVAGLCGVGFLIGAFYIWLSDRYGRLETATGFGIGFIVLALVILLVHRLTARSRAMRVAERRKSDLTAMGIAAAIAALPRPGTQPCRARRAACSGHRGRRLCDLSRKQPSRTLIRTSFRNRYHRTSAPAGACGAEPAYFPCIEWPRPSVRALSKGNDRCRTGYQRTGHGREAGVSRCFWCLSWRWRLPARFGWGWSSTVRRSTRRARSSRAPSNRIPLSPSPNPARRP